MPFTVREFPNRTFNTIEEYKDFVRRRNALLKAMKRRREGKEFAFHRMQEAVLIKKRLIEKIMAYLRET